jgi:hypothetical protein
MIIGPSQLFDLSILGRHKRRRLASTKAVPVVQSLRFVQIVQAVVGVDSARFLSVKRAF